MVKAELRAAVEKLIETVPEGQERQQFAAMQQQFFKLFERYENEDHKKTQVEWSRIAAPTEDVLKDYERLESVDALPRDEVRRLLGELVVVKLNGGLGTTMGCTGPKSVIEVRQGATFLDLTVQQIHYLNTTYDVDIPLVLMNSFNTDTETEQIVRKYTAAGAPYRVRVLCFNQKQYPRVVRDTLLPMPTTAHAEHINRDEWFPPGHGDVYDSLYRSPLYAELRSAGKRYMFLSNIDNLGATVDVRILRHIVANKVDFCMEVTPKTRADVKGGTLIRYGDKVKLLEIASVPKEHVEEFKSIRKFKIFNTNNLWVRLDAIESKLDQLSKQMDLIVNAKKAADGRDVIQLETAAGSAVEVFDKSLGVTVSRTRFLPVKACGDLLLVQSALYKVEHGSLVFNPERLDKVGDAALPLVRLGPAFKKVGDYMDRVGRHVPDMLELEHLTVYGDVRFGKDVVLRGQVIVVAPPGRRIELPDKTVLENKVVTVSCDDGSLRIEDHI